MDPPTAIGCRLAPCILFWGLLEKGSWNLEEGGGEDLPLSTRMMLYSLSTVTPCRKGTNSKPLDAG